jgi:hypothetical protein
MVVAQLGVGADDALALLRAHAFAHGWPLARVAQSVLSRQLDFAGVDAETDPDTSDASRVLPNQEDQP